MKCIANRIALLTALDACRPCIAVRSPKPILRNVKLYVGQETTMEATSLDQSILYHVSGVDARDYGTVLVDAAKLGEILKSTDDDEITVTLDGDTLTFRSDGGRFKLPTENAAEFPSCQWLDGEYQEIRGVELATAVKRVSFAADAENSRYALAAIAFDLTEHFAVATNGKCAVVHPLALNGVERDDDKSHLILVSPSAAANALKCISDPEELIRVRTCDSAIQFAAAKATHWSRLVEGRYPRWQDILPASPVQRVEFGAKELASAIRRAKVATSEESKGVTFAFKDDLLELSASYAGGEAETSLACQCQPLSVTFDPDLILGFLRVLDADARVEVKLVDGRKAALMEAGETRFVCMPLSKEAR